MLTQHWKILTPIKIGNALCKNRIIMAAHSYGYSDENGLPTQYLVDYLSERARGGAALVIMGGTSISKEGGLKERITYNINDSIISRYSVIANAVHTHGALVIDQLMHVGGQLNALEGVQIVAPSSVPHEYTKGIPAELSVSTMNQIINDFADAALRAKQGNLDGIELKGDQGFLIHQFLSPHFNKRLDDYGGDDKRRFEFLRVLLNKVRDKVQDNFIVGIRITGDSMLHGDINLEQSLEIVKKIEATGCVDYIHVNGATNSTWIGYLINHGDSSIESMNFVPLAKAVKQITQLPVIAASMITHPEEAEHIVSSGYADLVAMTRAHIADPEIVNKVKNNQLEDIRPCILCNQGCVGNHWRGYDVRCIHNPTTGRERELGIGTIESTAKPKKIAVVGGGIAGLECARVLNLRGHIVQVFEKERECGGQLRLAGKLPYRQGMIDIAKFLENQVRKQGVKFHMGARIDRAELDLLYEDFDVVVIATGSRPFVPPIYDNIPSEYILDMHDMLNGHLNIGDRILVVDWDWRRNPLGIAEWLLQQNKEVIVISTSFFVGEGIDEATLTSYYSRIMNRATLMPLVDLISITDGQGIVRNVVTNEKQNIGYINGIVFVAGAKPINPLDLEQMSNDMRIRTYLVGDCDVSLGIPEAMLKANRIAREI